MKFELMDSTEFVKYLATVLSAEPVYPGNSKHGTLPLHAVKTDQLPLALVKIVGEILNGEQVVDHVPEGGVKELLSQANGSKPLNYYQTTITSPEPGAMRSWHSNEFKHLPVLSLPGTLGDTSALGVKDRRSKAQKYHQYVVANKGQQNKMSGRTDGVHTGYIEFTATGWLTGHQDGRLVYDYVNNLIYLTLHYGKYAVEGKNPFFRLDWVWGSTGKIEP